MPQNENAPKRPLIEVLDDAFRKAMQSAEFEERTVNPTQYEVLETVYNELFEVIGGKVEIKLYPLFTSGSVAVKIPSIHLERNEVSKLKDILSKCSTLSIEAFTNGDIDFGVTVPGVFYPVED